MTEDTSYERDMLYLIKDNTDVMRNSSRVLNTCYGERSTAEMLHSIDLYLYHIERWCSVVGVVVGLAGLYVAGFCVGRLAAFVIKIMGWV